MEKFYSNRENKINNFSDFDYDSDFTINQENMKKNNKIKNRLLKMNQKMDGNWDDQFDINPLTMEDYSSDDQE